jgi:hypothetical protein
VTYSGAVRRVDVVQISPDLARVIVYGLGKYADLASHRNGCPPDGLAEVQYAMAEAAARSDDSRQREQERLTAAEILRTKGYGRRRSDGAGRQHPAEKIPLISRRGTNPGVRSPKARQQGVTRFFCMRIRRRAAMISDRGAAMITEVSDLVRKAITAITGPPQSMASVERTICKQTGFSLVPAFSQSASRIAKSSFGAMNPPQRVPAGDRSIWGRWDVAGHRTIYAGSPEACAYAESLAPFRPKIDIKLAELFDDDLEDWTLEKQVQKEWAERNHMRVAAIPQNWREERNICPLELPDSGWFVDIEAAESMAAIFQQHGHVLAAAGVEQLTTAHLHGENRILSTAIAERVHQSTLWDGSRPHGILYRSKHDGNWDCWAIWLRAVDDGKPVSAEPTRLTSTNEIKAPLHNDALRAVLKLFNLTCH